MKKLRATLILLIFLFESSALAETCTGDITSNKTDGCEVNSGTVTISSGVTVSSSTSSTPALKVTGNVTSITNNGTIKAQDPYGSSSSSGDETGTSLSTAQAAIQMGDTTTTTLDTLTNNGQIEGSIQFQTSTSGGTNNNNTITTLINNGTITGRIGGSGTIETLYNYGVIGGMYYVGGYGSTGSTGGTSSTPTVSIVHLQGLDITLGAWHSIITESASSFNSFRAYSDVDSNTDPSMLVSHLIYQSSSNGNGNGLKLTNNFVFYISVGDGFQFDTDYALSKLIVNESGNQVSLTYQNGGTVSLSDLYSHLTTTNSALVLSRNGDYFRIGFDGQNSVGNSYLKSNIQATTNLISQARSHIFGHYDRNILTKNKVIKEVEREVKTTRERKSYTKREYDSGKVATIDESGKLITQEMNETNRALIGSRGRTENAENKDSFILSNNRGLLPKIGLGEEKKTQETDTTMVTDYVDAGYATIATDLYYFFTPFVTYNTFYNSGMDLDGLSYGFLTGLNGKLNKSNTLGAHLGFSYGSVGQESYTDSLDISTLSILLGLHYKFDMVYGMYIKAFAEFIYQMNNVEYAVVGSGNVEQKPNSYGFDVSAYFGKAWNFNEAGKLELEGGLLYLGLLGSEMRFSNENTLSEYSTSGNTYASSFLNLLYFDIGLNYYVLWQSGWGLNAELGMKVMITTPQAEMTTLGNTYKYKVGTDRYNGYFGIGASYFATPDVELGLNYYGIVGDTQMSHSGFFNVRVWW